MTHALKIWPEYYKDIVSEKKNFEIRVDDRPFKVGDTLLLQEYDRNTNLYTGRECKRIISYILNGHDIKFGLWEGYCIIGFKNEKIKKSYTKKHKKVADSNNEFPTKEEALIECERHISDWGQNLKDEEKSHYILGFKRAHEYIRMYIGK